MASKIVLCLLVTIASALANDRYLTRGNIELGDTYGAHLIYHEVKHRYGIPLVKREETVNVQGVDGEIIRGIFVSDLEGGGRSWIVSGGLGHRNVSIKLESSEHGEGYKFLIEVYAN